jgi:hypothetical protein
MYSSAAATASAAQSDHSSVYASEWPTWAEYLAMVFAAKLITIVVGRSSIR